MNKQIALAALAAVSLPACSETGGMPMGPPSAASLAARITADAAADGSAPGAVYALTNRISGNAVAVFRRAADGTLVAAGSVATGGAGTGSGLGSQGALALSDDGRWLFAVNAGSNEVSAFRVGAAGLSLTSRVGSGGTRPISLAVHGSLVYVLNGGGDGNISGFTVGANGVLAAIRGSSRMLSGAAVGPAQVAFSSDGRWLVVTEKTTHQLDLYAVGPDAMATGPTSYASAGGTPFGFGFGHRDELFVSEAAGSASSYVLGGGGRHPGPRGGGRGPPRRRGGPRGALAGGGREEAPGGGLAPGGPGRGGAVWGSRPPGFSVGGTPDGAPRRARPPQGADRPRQE